MEPYTGAERRGTLNGIERGTFQGMEVEDKLNVLFDYHVSLHNLVYSMFAERCPRQQAECSQKISQLEEEGDDREKRLRNMEGRKLWNTAASALGGIIGGAAAILAKVMFVDK